MDLAVGFFDGVHLGHRRILARADAALTFRDHPATVYAPDRAPVLVMTSEARLAAVAEALRPGDARPVRALDFTAEWAARPPAAFADWLRGEYPDLGTVVCGANWTFGAGGAGNAEFLRARGFRVEVVPFETWDGRPISSTRVRSAIAAGELVSVAQMLGRPWALEGVVASGKGMGRTLGYPTINVLPARNLVRPPRGVYAVETEWGNGIANYGVAPTMGDRAWTEPVLEVHLLDAGKVPAVPDGRKVSVSLRRFVRPERAFSSFEELRAQIARDVVACR